MVVKTTVKPWYPSLYYGGSTCGKEEEGSKQCPPCERRSWWSDPHWKMMKSTEKKSTCTTGQRVRVYGLTWCPRVRTLPECSEHVWSQLPWASPLFHWCRCTWGGLGIQCCLGFPEQISFVFVLDVLTNIPPEELLTQVEVLSPCPGRRCQAPRWQSHHQAVQPPCSRWGRPWRRCARWRRRRTPLEPGRRCRPGRSCLPLQHCAPTRQPWKFILNFGSTTQMVRF